MPNQPAFWNNLGETYRQADRLVEAHQALHKALQLTRKMPEVFYNLGNTLKQLGRHEEAVGAYEAALRLKPDYDRAWYNLGNALREIGRLASAVAAYLKALDLKSEWADAHLNLANAHFDQRELSGAVAEYQRAIQLKPEDPSLEDSLGNALVAQGQIESAAAAYRRANARRPGNWLRQMRCDLLAPPVAPDLAFIDAYRARVTAALDRYADRGQAALPDLHTSGAEPPMLLAYHGRDDRLLMQRFAEFFANRLPTVDPPKRREGKPRIGWVVTHGHEGVFVRCLGELVARLNSDVLESRILCSRSGANVLTHLRQGVAYDYLILPERVDQAAELIRKEEFDLLYYWEIGTDSVNYFLPFFILALEHLLLVFLSGIQPYIN
jgi:tetratricopeptide (TPR) repeat protein